ATPPATPAQPGRASDDSVSTDNSRTHFLVYLFIRNLAFWKKHPRFSVRGVSEPSTRENRCRHPPLGVGWPELSCVGASPCESSSLPRSAPCSSLRLTRRHSRRRRSSN